MFSLQQHFERLESHAAAGPRVAHPPRSQGERVKHLGHASWVCLRESLPLAKASHVSVSRRSNPRVEQGRGSALSSKIGAI
jgi:hypothetical protein